jgi:hypothetical protein
MMAGGSNTARCHAFCVNIYQWSRAVAVSENYAYVGADYLFVVDIADPAHPRLVDNYVTEREIVDVKVQGGQVANDSSGPAWGVAIDGRYAYVAEWNSFR